MTNTAERPVTMPACTRCGTHYSRAKGAFYAHLTICSGCNGEVAKGYPPFVSRVATPVEATPAPVVSIARARKGGA